MFRSIAILGMLSFASHSFATNVRCEQKTVETPDPAVGGAKYEKKVGFQLTDKTGGLFQLVYWDGKSTKIYDNLNCSFAMTDDAAKLAPMYGHFRDLLFICSDSNATVWRFDFLSKIHAIPEGKGIGKAIADDTFFLENPEKLDIRGFVSTGSRHEINNCSRD